jgi:hypothetical protein
LLRGLLPFGAKLVVEEEQKTDYEMYMVNEHGLEMYLPIQLYCIPENTPIEIRAAINDATRKYSEARKVHLQGQFPPS